MVSGLLCLKSTGPLKVGLHGCLVTRGHRGHQTSTTHQQVVARGHEVMCCIQSLIVLPSMGEDVRMRSSPFLHVLLHDPDLLLVLLGVVLDMLPQTAGVSVPLATSNNFTSIRLLKMNKIKLFVYSFKRTYRILMGLLVFSSVTRVGESLLALFEVLAKEGFLSGVTSVVDLQVLKSGKTSSTPRLFTFERPLSSMDTKVGHEFVLGIEWLVLTTAILENNLLVNISTT